MAILGSKPSRSYANVEHNPEGLAGTGSKPYHSKSERIEGGFKTFRPPISESHLRRTVAYDPHPTSSFAPLPTIQLHRHKKEAAIAGQRAEVDHMLEPGYKSSGIEGDNNSIAGPSRINGTRTAGGLANPGDKKGKSVGLSVRSSSSVGSFRSARSKLAGGSGAGGVSGLYTDSSGRIHDTEYDPFGNVAEKTRKMSRRRSAFGSDRRKGSDESSTSDSGSEVNVGMNGGPGRASSSGHGHGHGGKAGDGVREEDEIRRRLESDRKRMDEVSLAKRRSILSDGRASLSGRGTPSIRSNEDGDRLTIQSSLMDRRAKSAQAYYTPSPLSPTFSQAGSYTTARTLATTMEGLDGEETPEKPTKTTETTSPRPPRQSDRLEPPFRESEKEKEKAKGKEKVEIKRDGSVKVTGFDAPSSPMPTTPGMESQAGSSAVLRVPDSARSRVSAGSRASSERDRERDKDRQKPRERRREELFPETPAQMKRREERAARSRPSVTSRVESLSIDPHLASHGSRRVLPEIEIVEDDDPRVFFPPENSGTARTTKVQVVHDHVIRGPFSLAMNAQGSNPTGPGSSLMGGNETRRASSARSIPFSNNSGPSSLLDEAPNGYLPSRWANGDRMERVTEEEKERYRPREWGGKHGDLAGKPEEWKPDVKDAFKRTMKDFSTGARFSLLKAKKKLGR